ncbi:MAG: DUF896 domain-containing protein [Oscillospiraceae bacterium]|nr:DUF896 domain-containing protein [Oscillospiraceae bacterium]
MEQARLARINELAKIAKTRELTAEEQAERALLRKEYLADFRKAFQQQLSSTYIQYDDGHKVPLTELRKKK